MLEVASECATHPFTISHYIFSHIVRRVFVWIKLTINMKMVWLIYTFHSVVQCPCVRSNGKINTQIKIITIPIHFLYIFSVLTQFVDFDSKYVFALFPFFILLKHCWEHGWQTWETGAKGDRTHTHTHKYCAENVENKHQSLCVYVK